MRIVCISDTHGKHDGLSMPDGDVLIHAGDLSMRGTQTEIERTFRWLESQQHRQKIVIAGNHDFFFDERFPDGHRFRNWEVRRTCSVRELLDRFPTLTYLQDSACSIEGVKFYGSPWQPWFRDWAFNFPRDDNGIAAASTWSAIDDDTSILVTHGPAYRILDKTEDDRHVGCPELAKRLSTLSCLKANVFGHVHEAYGSTVRGKVTYANAAILDFNYHVANKPICLDL